MRSDYFEKELELINRFTREKLDKEDVYVFTVILCDNEIDRDNEAFSVDSLFELERLLVGKTGIITHKPEHRNSRFARSVSAVKSAHSVTYNGKRSLQAKR